MPIVTLLTNLKDGDIPADFERQLTEKVAEALNKPIERCTITVVSGARQVRFGSSEPTAVMSINSIGVFDAERNPQYTDKLVPYLADALKLKPSRVLLHYIPLDPAFVGQKME